MIGQPTKVHRWLSQEVREEPKATFKAQQASLASVIVFKQWLSNKRLGKKAINGRVWWPWRFLTENNPKVRLTTAIQKPSEDFLETNLWTDRTEVELFGICASPYALEKHDHDYSQTQWSFNSQAALLLQDLDNLPELTEPCILPSNITSWRNIQESVCHLQLKHTLLIEKLRCCLKHISQIPLQRCKRFD